MEPISAIAISPAVRAGVTAGTEAVNAVSGDINIHDVRAGVPPSSGPGQGG